jgi:hypothetical protein
MAKTGERFSLRRLTGPDGSPESRWIKVAREIDQHDRVCFRVDPKDLTAAEATQIHDAVDMAGTRVESADLFYDPEDGLITEIPPPWESPADSPRPEPPVLGESDASCGGASAERHALGSACAPRAIDRLCFDFDGLEVVGPLGWAVEGREVEAPDSPHGSSDAKDDRDNPPVDTTGVNSDPAALTSLAASGDEDRALRDNAKFPVVDCGPSGEDPEEGDASGPKARMKRPRYYVGAALALMFAAVYYLVFIDCYRVETHVLFPPERRISAEKAAGRVLEQERGIMESALLFHLVATDLSARRSGCPGACVTTASGPDPAWLSEASAGKHTGRLEDVGGLVKWLAENVTVSAESTPGLVAVSITGTDPDFLKDVLRSYIRNYYQFSRRLAAEQRDASPASHPANPTAEAIVPAGIRDRLEAAEHSLQGCELALGQMGEGKGPFRGFLPDEYLGGMPSLKVLQSKIVETEIEKMALSARFKPNSREIREKDEQIAQLRNSMKECIVEHQAFLKRIKKSLADEVAGIRPSGHRPAPNKSAQTASLETQNVPAGVQIQKSPYLTCSPFVSRTPLLVRLSDYTTSLLFGSTIGPRAPMVEAGSARGLKSLTRANAIWPDRLD